MYKLNLVSLERKTESLPSLHLLVIDIFHHGNPMFSTTGTLHYDPQAGKTFDLWWALLQCDEQLAEYYAWLLKRRGVEVHSNAKGLWGTHVSVLKGDPPPNPEAWGKYEGFEVEFHYNHLIRYDNGKHAWTDVYSEQLSEIRMELGFTAKPWYHLTVGRLVRPYEVDFAKYGIT